MPNTWFRFKKFTIEQQQAAMKVGTDGVLLGAWASLPDSCVRVLDIGTGTGLIALMMAQRKMDVRVDALEIDRASAKQAEENFRNSPWTDRLYCIHSSFQDFSSHCEIKYDQLICNPPFFSGSKKTESKEKNLARHDDSLNLSDIFAGSVRVLNKTGIMSLIIPVQKEVQAMDLMNEHLMHCRRLTRVVPAPGKSVKRLLLELSFTEGPKIEDELTIETGTRHRYTDKYQKLVDDFYLGKNDW